MAPHAVELGHLQVHQQHIRRGMPDDGHRLPAVGGLPDHFEVLLCRQQTLEPGPEDRVVVGDDDADAHETAASTLVSPPTGRSIGRVRLIVVPSPGTLSTMSEPCSPSARSRMPVSP